MPSLQDTLREELARLDAASARRVLRPTAPLAGAQVLRDAKLLVSFSGNDYLGLSRHPAVLEAGLAALRDFGAGAGGSRLVTGEHPLYAKLEATLAQVKGTQSACVFGSGYLANVGTLAALAGHNDLLVADKLVHACILDGARLSGAKLLRFAHNDVDQCRSLLEQNRRQYRRCLVVTETVFSMDGDLGKVEELGELARHHDAWLMTDDAHGLGILKNSEPLNSADVRMGTLSKAVGVYGGYVAGSGELSDYLKTAARSVMFSTALPAVVVAMATAGLELLRDRPELGELALTHARRFTAATGLPAAQSAVVPLVVGSNSAALAASAALEARGLLVTAIRPPTVPEGTARLRLTFSALHTAEQVDTLIGAVREVGLCA